MISKAAMRVRKRIKFGVAIPATYNKAVEIDIFNDNMY